MKRGHILIVILALLCIFEVVWDHSVTSFALSVSYSFFHKDFQLLQTVGKETERNFEMPPLGKAVEKGSFRDAGIGFSYSSWRDGYEYYYRFENFGNVSFCATSWDLILLTGKNKICLAAGETKYLIVTDKNRWPTVGAIFLCLREKDSWLPGKRIGFHAIIPR